MSKIECGLNINFSDKDDLYSGGLDGVDGAQDYTTGNRPVLIYTKCPKNVSLPIGLEAKSLKQGDLISVGNVENAKKMIDDADYKCDFGGTTLCPLHEVGEKS